MTRSILWLAAGAAAGIALGILTSLGQGALPDALQQFANAGSVWVVAAFAAGALIRRPLWAVLAGGFLTQACAVIGYYGYVDGTDGDKTWPLLWLGFAVVAGPLFGLAGSWARDRDRSPWRRVAGVATLGAVFVMDALWLLAVLRYTGTGMAFLAIGLGIPLAARAWWGVPLAAVLGGGMFGGYYLVAAATGGV